MRQTSNMEKPSEKSVFSMFLMGFWKRNPVFVLMVGFCPLVAITVTTANSICIALVVSFVLVSSGITLSLLRKVIPEEIKMAVLMLVASVFTTIAALFIRAGFPQLSTALGIYLPLVVMNCIILDRISGYTRNDSVLFSLLDSIGSSAGFSLVLVFTGFLREITGTGKLAEIQLFDKPVNVIALYPGGFLTVGVLLALINWFVLEKG